MLSDFRFAFRQLIQSPGFTLLAVLSLSLGIGANTVVFGLVNELFLRALPVREPESLVILRNVAGERGGMARSTEGYGSRDAATGRHSTTSFPLLARERFAEQRTVLSEVFAFAPFWQCNALVNGQPDIAARAQLASGNYHQALGVRPWIGRLLEPTDDLPGAEPVAVISYRFWQRHFSGSSSAIGQTVELNKVALTIVGVTPEAFAGTAQVGEHFDVTAPLSHHLKFQPENADKAQPWYWWIRVMGRLAPAVTREQAEAALTPVFVNLARESWEAIPRTTPGERPGDPLLRVEPGFQGESDNRHRTREPLRLIVGLAGVVLLAACANVANLLLVRAAARRREIAVRMSLGATRARIVRQLLSESLLLGFAASAVGLLLAWAGRRAVIAWRPFDITFELPIDWRVLAFAVGAAIATAIVFGLAPALRATRLNLSREFQGGRSAHGGRSWLSRSLMVLQIALALMLLVSTGLIVRSLQQLERVDAGFNRRGLIAFHLDTMAAGYHTPEKATALRSRLQERLAEIGGVRGVTYSRLPLLSRAAQTSSITIPGVTLPPGTSLDVFIHAVAPNFFVVTELPLLLGRGLTDADAGPKTRVAVVNETFAKRFFGGDNPLGRTFQHGSEDPEIEIVGIVRDAKYADLRSEAPATIYFSALQQPLGPTNFLLRAEGELTALFPAIRSAVQQVDASLPVLDLRTQDDQIDRLHAQEILFAKVAGLFGALVLTLAIVGIYGLMSYTVARRTGEIGVRMALGALPRDVLALFLRESLGLVLLGMLGGAFAAWGAARLLGSMLFGLTASDPLTYTVAGGLLLVVALIASALPARRAARLEPTEALRTE